MKENEFEEYWKANKQQLLNADSDYIKAKNKYKASSGADWLLYAIPAVAGIVFMDYCPIEQELLKWVLSAAVTIICFVVCVWVKSLYADDTTPETAERDLKKRLHDKMVK